ncbi:MAG: hypothetical protein FH747_13895 [Stenotrophomonas sp.]|uniref:phage tail tube protein n=1 Tax=Stenotrophomonas sp. TaxID=69392 RepID=UPI001354B556|nr:hypothetical protein [Stenotrophomonas sp.]MTI74727.1 hypothetical protein [Stenotrophomonas sp.]
MNRNLFSLQGYIKAGLRNAATGKPGPLFWLGNVPEATLEITVESADKRESFSGNRGLYKRMYTQRGGTFSGSMDEWSLKNLALLLHSQSANVASSPVTAEAFPAALVDGDEVLLAHPYAASLVITDSTSGTPLTVDPDDYELVGHNSRIVQLKNVASYVQPFKAAYTPAAYDKLDFFSKEPDEIYVVFDGIDTEYNVPVEIDLFRAQFAPLANFAMINEEFGNLPFSAELLFDSLNTDSNGKGGYARLLSKSPVA